MRKTILLLLVLAGCGQLSINQESIYQDGLDDVDLFAYGSSLVSEDSKSKYDVRVINRTAQYQCFRDERANQISSGDWPPEIDYSEIARKCESVGLDEIKEKTKGCRFVKSVLAKPKTNSDVYSLPDIGFELLIERIKAAAVDAGANTIVGNASIMDSQDAEGAYLGADLYSCPEPSST